MDWLTPARCRWLLAVILAAGFFLHFRYLTHDCPIDLSEDETYYWDWSRQLDWSYYSKGPVVALIIRAGCAVFGDTMLGVRFPSLVLAVLTSLVTYWTTKRLFASERLALGAVLLNHTVPMFIAGSVLMTIDPPAYLFWGTASMFLVEAVFHEKRWAWVAAGLAVGVGFLAKFVVPVWFVGIALFFMMDQPSRKWLKTPWPWLMLLVAAPFATPVIVWNVQHGWVNVQHVAVVTGATEKGGFSFVNVLEFLGGQFGAMGPALWVFFVGGLVAAWKATERRRELRLLMAISLPVFIIIGSSCVRTKVQVNWPVYAYFGWIILAAWFISTRLQSVATWRLWRGWLWMAIGIALVFSPIAHNTEPLYPLMNRLGKAPRRWDPTYRLRGWSELGRVVSERRKTLRPDSFLLGDKGQLASELAFYTEGQPKTYSVGSWFASVKRRSRSSQFDVWPDRRLDRPELLGKDAIYLGDNPDDPEHPGYDLMAAFDSFERLPPVEIHRNGVKVRVFNLWIGRGFKGMTWPGDSGKR